MFKKKPNTRKYKTKGAKKKTRLIISASIIAVFSVVAIVSVMIVSQRNTTPESAQADSNFTPDINKSYGEAFNKDKINLQKWSIYKNKGVLVRETKGKNLVITAPKGADGSKSRYGGLTFKELIRNKSDFRIHTSVFKPIVTGKGRGTSGIIFASKDSNNDEFVRISWIVEGITSKLVMTVKAADGNVIESKATDVLAAKLTIRLVRVGNTYIASYKVGVDDDGKWEKISSVKNSSLGSEGRLRIFTNNSGKDKKYPKVVGRFDSAVIGWFDANSSDKDKLYDNFKDGKVDEQKWSINAKPGTSITENAGNNLAIRVSASKDGKVKQAVLTTKKTISAKKSFTANVQLLKPVVKGDGEGRSGVRYLTNGSSNDEKITLLWQVSPTKNNLLFTAFGANGKEIAKSRQVVKLDKNVNKITVRLNRNGEKGYNAVYKVGANDSDKDWKKLSNGLVRMQNSANGRLQLFAHNVGVNKKYPVVIGRFDLFSLVYDN